MSTWPSTPEEARELLALRVKLATPRGKDVRKLPKPYSCRDVIFECSNGWRIERLVAEDYPVEGWLMGHCLGTQWQQSCTAHYSLREPDGTPHVTIVKGVGRFRLFGRCNAYPKNEYVALVNELCVATGREKCALDGSNSWGVDDDAEYHEKGKLTDRDFRDLEHGRGWRDDDWYEKRAEMH